MITIQSLPYELFYIICDDLTHRDKSRLARSCHGIYSVVNNILYRDARNDLEILCWAAEKGRLGAVKKLIAAGADPNRTWRPEETQQISLDGAHFQNRPVHISSSLTQPLPLGTPMYAVPPQPRHSSLGAQNFQQGFQHVQQHALQDYQLQLMLLEQQNLRRNMLRNSAVHTGTTPQYNANPHSSGLPSRRLDERISLAHTPLHMAAKNGHNEIIELLLHHGANIDALSKDLCSSKFLATASGYPEWTPLHIAICEGHIATAKLLMERGASFIVGPRASSDAETKVTALHAACALGDIAMSEAVMSHYLPDLETKDHTDRTPLAWAYEFHKLETMQLLLDNGANINATLSPGRTLLIDACANRRFEEALWLLENGADARAALAGIGTTALHYSCLETCQDPKVCYKGFLGGSESGSLENRFRLVKALLRAGADVNVADATPDNPRPIMSAASGGWPEIVAVLLDHGAEVNAVHGRVGKTPLIAACHPTTYRLTDSHCQTIELLLDRNVSVNHLDLSQKSALEWLCRSSWTASSWSRNSLLELLLQRGAKPDAAWETNDPPLLLLFLKNDIKSCRLLLEHGAKVPKPPHLRTMITRAVAKDDDEALQFVLSLDGSKRLLKTPTRVFSALRNNKPSVIKTLLSNGAPISYNTRDGVSCLLQACQLPRQHLDVVKQLLIAGADPNHADNKGQTPLHVAITKDNLPLVELLLEHGATPDLKTQQDQHHLSPLGFASKEHMHTLLEPLVGHSSASATDHYEQLLKLSGPATTGRPCDTRDTPFEMTSTDGFRSLNHMTDAVSNRPPPFNFESPVAGL